MTAPANNTTQKFSWPAVLLLGLGIMSLGCSFLTILFLIWGQVTQPPMYEETEQVIGYLVCFTSPCLLVAATLLAGGYYVYRRATAPDNPPPAVVPQPAPPVEVHPAMKSETPVQPVEPEAKEPTGSPPAPKYLTPLENNVEGLIDILKDPDTNDTTVELTIEALVDLGFPAMEALSKALKDESRITRLIKLREQGADIEPLLRTAIASAAKYYRYRSLFER